jgi:hypothetical protein
MIFWLASIPRYISKIHLNLLNQFTISILIIKNLSINKANIKLIFYKQINYWKA